MMIVFRILLHIPTNRNREPFQQLQCILNKYIHSNKVFQDVINCFKITLSPVWRVIIHRKPYKKLNMINVIDLHMLT